jgi:hypothetical protein
MNKGDLIRELAKVAGTKKEAEGVLIPSWRLL